MVGDCLCNYDPQVKALRYKAMACGHKKSSKDRRATLFPGREINIFLQSLGVVTDSRDGITTHPTGVVDNKQY